MAYIGNSPANVGNYAVVDDIASSFNGTTTSFALTSLSQAINPAKSGQLLVSVNGVLQEPDDTGADGFKVSGSNIVFSSAPASGSTFWCVYQGQTVDVGVPSDGTIGTAKMSYPLGNFSSTGIDDNATSNAITIDSSERVGIGASNPATKLHLLDNTANAGPMVRLQGSGQNAANNLLGGIEIFNGDSSSNGPQVVCNIKAFSRYSSGRGGYLIFSTNTGTAGAEGSEPTERMRIDAGGDVKVNTGNLVIGTSGKGIDFSANANASGMTSELLDDYEEGTHDVTLTASSSGSWTARTGFSTLRYTKIGGTLVHITGQVECLGSSSPSGELRVSLPFTIRSNNDSRLKVSVAMDGIGAHSFRTFAYFSYGNSYFTIRKYHDDGSTGNLDNGDLDSAWEFHISATYRT